MDKSAKEMFEDLGYECNDYSDKPKKASPLCKEVTLRNQAGILGYLLPSSSRKELLDKIFPVGCIYNILYDLWGDEEEQIKNGLYKLNNMIGEWEYFGILYAGLAICFKRKK